MLEVLEMKDGITEGQIKLKETLFEAFCGFTPAQRLNLTRKWGIFLDNTNETDYKNLLEYFEFLYKYVCENPPGVEVFSKDILKSEQKKRIIELKKAEAPKNIDSVEFSRYYSGDKQARRAIAVAEAIKIIKARGLELLDARTIDASKLDLINPVQQYADWIDEALEIKPSDLDVRLQESRGRIREDSDNA
jgi:hypothetical protein